jgi:hypothetical protein
VDLSLVELRIRALPGVVACQFTATAALVLVGPDGDGDAVRAAVTAVLDQAASELSVNVLAVPARAAVVPLWRRRKAAFALAGSAAALSATVAAAATVGVVAGSPRAPRAEIAAPLVLSPVTPAPPALNATATPAAPADAATMLDVTIELASTSTPIPAPTPPSAPVDGPVLLHVPLPHPLVAAARTPSLQPSPVAVASPLVAAAAGSVPADGSDDPPRGRARRVRAGIDRSEHAGPAPSASPVATNEGARHDDAETPPHHESKKSKD